MQTVLYNGKKIGTATSQDEAEQVFGNYCYMKHADKFGAITDDSQRRLICTLEESSYHPKNPQNPPIAILFEGEYHIWWDLPRVTRAG